MRGCFWLTAAIDNLCFSPVGFLSRLDYVKRGGYHVAVIGSPILIMVIGVLVEVLKGRNLIPKQSAGQNVRCVQNVLEKKQPPSSAEKSPID